MRETTINLPDTRHYARGEAVPLTASLSLTLLIVSFVFIVFPGIDLAVSRWFADGGAFPLSEKAALKAIRDFNRAVPYCLLPLMAAAVLIYAIWPRRLDFFAPHKAFFVIASFALGPGLMVQLGKSFFGRPRPTGILEFGGTADFAPVWQFAGLCSRSCSFPSGEAALAAATMSILVFVPPAIRRSAEVMLTLFLLVVVFNRVLFGAHFLSDVLIAWFGTLWVMSWLSARIAQSADRINEAVRGFAAPIRRGMFNQGAD
jgi:lipid A 4'-phosphatase